MIRGEIWWASLPKSYGSESAERRPVVVLQADSMNKSAISTVVCASITTNTNLARAPGNILLEKAESRLEKTSVINLSQIATVDKSLLTENVCMLSKKVLSQIETGLKIVFDLR